MVTPASRSAAIRVATSWRCGSTSYGGSPSVYSVQPRRYGALRTRAQPVDELVGPQVLVHVDGAGLALVVSRSSDSASFHCSK